MNSDYMLYKIKCACLRIPTIAIQRMQVREGENYLVLITDGKISQHKYGWRILTGFCWRTCFEKMTCLI